MNNFPGRSIYFFLYLFSVTITLLLFYFYFGSSHLLNLDVDEQFYYSNAEKIVDGKYTLNTYRPIGFVAILSFLLFITKKNLVITQIFLILISCLKTPLTYLLAKKILGYSMVALLSAIGVSLWPTLLFYSISFYSETVAIPCFIGVLCLLPRGSYLSVLNKKTRNFFFSGSLLALCSLVHPMYICFLPFALVIILLEEKKMKTAFKEVGYFLAAVAITLLPWSLTASIHNNTFVFLSDNSVDALAGALNSTLIKQGFKAGKSPDGRETWSGPGTWIDNQYLEEDERNLSQLEKNNLIFNRMKSWIKTHPRETLFLQASKLMNMWGVYPLWLNNPQRFFLGNVPIVALLILSISSLIKFKGDLRRLCRFWILPLFVSAVAMISWGSWRYRQSADIGLIILSSLYVYSFIYSRFKDKSLNFDSMEGL